MGLVPQGVTIALSTLNYVNRSRISIYIYFLKYNPQIGNSHALSLSNDSLKYPHITVILLN